MPEPCFPEAVAPERRRHLDSHGVKLVLHEWGDPQAPPVLLAHGMWDHGRGFDLLAPRLAEHFRVVALDARGHGDSGWADAYSWPSDVADLVNALRSLGARAHLVGHSKGGGQVMDAACMAPELVRSVVQTDLMQFVLLSLAHRVRDQFAQLAMRLQLQHVPALQLVQLLRVVPTG